MRFSAQSRQIDTDTVVVAFYRERVCFALQVLFGLKDFPVGMPEVCAVGDVIGVRKLRIQSLGRLGATIPQRPPANLFGRTINSPPESALLFFFQHTSTVHQPRPSEPPRAQSLAKTRP